MARLPTTTEAFFYPHQLVESTLRKGPTWLTFVTGKPLLHAVIFLIELVIMSRLIAKFNAYYAERPGKQQHTYIRSIEGAWR